ncbi:hypothetical protein [Bacillus sp. T3]|uniref:hypothetical protein n=1 Tax=Bacillus sp. T3 TaxID=467262 RepID=UPI00298101B4|nr:hypothetical protein [Bacillus sp. T3]
MVSRELEFRGINRQHLEMYFEELGGKRNVSAEAFLAAFTGEGWEAQIVSEDDLTFTAVFKVNAVIVRFVADDDASLEELIKHYRYKTTRVGG